MPSSFAALGVPASIADALAKRGITEPFAIQAEAIGHGLEGKDICGRAPTGSGKTIAFGIPLVVDLPPASKRRPCALVLAPTRELAEQIGEELYQLGRPLNVSVVTIYGGVGYGNQRSKLARGVDIVVACPGRLEDLLERGALSLGDVERVVIDEADRMADMGFVPAVRRILDVCAGDRQTMLFSATLDGAVGDIRRRYQHDPVMCEVDDPSADPDLEHLVRQVSRDERASETADLVKSHGTTIVFCRTKRGADRVARRLTDFGVHAVPIHGDRSQSQRARALEAFASGRAQALVATDIAARGIHVDDVACVVHFDPPEDAATYLHRSGRTGRAGNTGVVVSLVVDPQQRKDASKVIAALDAAAERRKDAVKVPAGVGATASARASATRTKPEPRTTPEPRTASAPDNDGLRGSVKYFNPRKGFGFIGHGDRDLFVHKSQITGRIKVGQTVRFDVGTGPRGDEAHQVAAV